MGRNLVAHISKEALVHNLNRVRELAPQSKILAMVKANAYGHGLVKVAQALETADALGVACIEEALALRHAGVATDIFLMEGFFNRDELELIAKHQLTVVIHSPYQIEAIKKHPFKQKLRIWLKLNSGMNRLGLPLSEAPALYQAISKIDHLDFVGFMGHFPQADEKDNPITFEQYTRFMEATVGLPGQRSMANSAAILGWQPSQLDWVRPGLMLYGASPFNNTVGHDFGLKHVMTLSSDIIATQQVQPGDKVGYGGTWTCQKPTTIGIVAVGYGDGYPWQGANQTQVSIQGRLYDLIGRVSMDMIAIDLGQSPSVGVGSQVILWGDTLPVEVVAKCCGTIPWELFCRLTDRVKILWKNQG